MLKSVYLHAWRNAENGDCEACDASLADGWCVYVRGDYNDETGPCFDVLEEKDFKDYETALTYGDRLARKLGATLEEY
jgi:hypothetical protein